MLKISALINLSVYGIALLLGAIGAVIGLVRGACRQTIRFITVIASAVLSFLACLAIYPMVMGYFEGLSMQDVINMAGSALAEPLQKIVACIEASLIGDIVSLPLAFLVMPLIFVLLFMIISLLMIILHKVVSGALAFTTKRNNTLTRIGGAALGFVQGIVVAAILLVPISGTLATTEAALVKASESYPEAHNAVELNDSFYNNFGSAVKNPVMQMSTGISNLIYGTWSTVKVEGEDIDVRSVIDSAVDVVVLLGDLSECDFNSFTPEQKDAVRAITKNIYSNRYLAIIFSGFLRSFSEMVDEDAITISFEDPVGPFVEHFIAVFATSDKENLADDVKTLENVIFIFADDGAINTMKETPDKMFEKFIKIGDDGHTLLGRIELELSKNPRMIEVAHELSMLSMSLVLHDKGQEMEKAEEALKDVTGAIDDVVNMDKESFDNEEDYKQAVNETIDAVLKDYGIDVVPEKVDELADFVLEEFGDKQDITEAEITDFMVKYYELYYKYQDFQY